MITSRGNRKPANAEDGADNLTRNSLHVVAIDQRNTAVVLTGEGSPGDAEYQEFFRQQAALYGVEILQAHYFQGELVDSELDEVLQRFRALQPEA